MIDIRSNTIISKKIIKILTVCLACMMMMSFPAFASKTFLLESFQITYYGDQVHQWSAFKSNKLIQRSKLALTFQAIQKGNGNISSVSIDGKELSYSDYDDRKVAYETNDNSEITAWKHTVRIKPYVMDDMKNGIHKVTVVCAGQEYKTADQVLDDWFAFDLED